LYPWQQRNSSARRCQLVVVVAEVSVAAGRLLKSYLEVYFRIGDAKAVYSPGTPLSSFLSVAQKTVGRQVDITTTY
jgi:hypothetical protein